MVPRYLSSLACDDDSSLLLDVGTGSDTLVVTFASLGGASGVASFEFFNSIFPFDVDKIFVRDMFTSWYLQGLRGLTHTISDTAAYLRSIIDECQYKHVVFIGYSMGGFGAIAHGVLAGARVILAFGPQTFVDPLNRAKHGDSRWTTEMASIPPLLEPRFQDMKVLINSTNYSGAIHLYYPTDHRLDQVHAVHLGSCRQVVLHKSGNGGHRMVQKMKSAGQLYRILRNFILPNAGDRLLSVWKDQAEIGVDAALDRHDVRMSDYIAYANKHQDVISAQQSLLTHFFDSIEEVLVRGGNLVCVTEQVVPQHFRHCPDFCRRWFTDDKKKFFGSFFAFCDPCFLFYVALGEKNMHVGVVRYMKEVEGRYTVLPTAESEFVSWLESHAACWPEELQLIRRNWGPLWYSVDCGRFDNPERYGTYVTMANFERSQIFRHVFRPFIKLLNAASCNPAIPIANE